MPYSVSHTIAAALRTTYCVPQIGSKLARLACGTKRSVRAAAPCAIAGAANPPVSASPLAPANPFNTVLRSMFSPDPTCLSSFAEIVSKAHAISAKGIHLNANEAQCARVMIRRVGKGAAVPFPHAISQWRRAHQLADDSLIDGGHAAALRRLLCPPHTSRPTSSHLPHRRTVGHQRLALALDDHAISLRLAME